MVEADLDVFSVVAAKDSQREGSQGWGHKDNILAVCGLLETVWLLSISPSLPSVFYIQILLTFLLHLFT